MWNKTHPITWIKCNLDLHDQFLHSPTIFQVMIILRSDPYRRTLPRSECTTKSGRSSFLLPIFSSRIFQRFLHTNQQLPCAVSFLFFPLFSLTLTHRELAGHPDTLGNPCYLTQLKPQYSPPRLQSMCEYDVLPMIQPQMEILHNSHISSS